MLDAILLGILSRAIKQASFQAKDLLLTVHGGELLSPECNATTPFDDPLPA